MHEPERTWKVGELARATGLTIRALQALGLSRDQVERLREDARAALDGSDP
jgi:hypothetical protein